MTHTFLEWINSKVNMIFVKEPSVNKGLWVNTFESFVENFARYKDTLTRAPTHTLMVFYGAVVVNQVLITAMTRKDKYLKTNEKYLLLCEVPWYHEQIFLLYQITQLRNIEPKIEKSLSSNKYNCEKYSGHRPFSLQRQS